MKKSTLIILGSIIALVAAWMILLPGKTPWSFLKSKTPATVPGDVLAAPTIKNGSLTPPASTSGDPAIFPLKVDVYNYKKEVAEIQRVMNVYFNTDLVVDGLFGPKTLAALKANGLAYGEEITHQDYLTLIEFTM